MQNYFFLLLTYICTNDKIKIIQGVKYMCKLGDIIVVKNFKGEDGTLLKKKKSFFYRY